MIIYSYVVFPWIMKLVSRGKKTNALIYHPKDELPFISIIMSAHNEEIVIKRKMETIFYTSYPLNRFEVLIGSDASTDNTNLICQIYAENYSNIRFFSFDQRSGKPTVINNLIKHARGEIVVITDANVMFVFNTMFELVKHFRNGSVGLVDSHIKNVGLRKQGISIQEDAYISREVRIKHYESISWGLMMGPFGGCYAVRKELYEPVPSNFLVDDFYINMNVLIKNKKAINNLEAIVIEDISNDIREEFRRKTRISAGNFQNLFAFRKLLLYPFSKLTFTFVSHKVLRWLGPIFIIISLITSILLANKNFFKIVVLSEVFIIMIPLIDFLLKKLKIHIVFLRFITHFLSMNLALLSGLVKFAGGISTNIWQPTRRKQSDEH